MNKGLNIIIIGASRGIGFEVARQLIQQGHNLFCVSRNKIALENLEKECKSINRKAHISTLSFDISRLTDGHSEFTGIVQKEFPRVDILLNNAGLLINKNFPEFSYEEAVQVFNVNFFSAALVVKSLIPLMGGKAVSHIVNTGSMGGFQGSSKFPGLSYYSASKAALASLSECLAEELKDRNIRVNCLALGAVRTEMLEEAFPGIKAPLSAYEMAEFISNFMISGHRFFNGKVLPVSVSTP
ncbi:MAG: SDR family oxidoreductase [Bacteroidales bacterium]